MDVCFLLPVLSGCLCLGTFPLQEDEQKETAAPATETRADDEESRFDELRQLIRGDDPSKAGQALRDALSADPDSPILHELRMTFVRQLLVSGDEELALAEAGPLKDYHLAHADDPKSASALAAVVNLLGTLYRRTNQSEKFPGVVDQALEAVSTHAAGDGSEALLSARTSLVTTKATTLALTDPAAAEQLLAQETEMAASRMAGTDSEELRSVWVQLMLVRTQLASRTDSERAAALTDELEAFLTAGLEAKPDSVSLLNALLSSRNSRISRIIRDERDRAEELLNQTSALLETSPLRENPAIARHARQLAAYPRMIAAARVVQAMIGQPVPELNIEAWAHGEPVLPETMTGKVILFDFWAVWCGPCVATFPHLKEWHEEFHDRGFEIVGITRRYGYSWDAESGKALRAPKVEDVPLETEVDALAKFMDSHGLHHPTIVQPEGSDMSTRFGVTGIPHVVLVDRNGIVRMVRVGSGNANAKLLREMIEQLLAE